MVPVDAAITQVGGFILTYSGYEYGYANSVAPRSLDMQELIFKSCDIKIDQNTDYQTQLLDRLLSQYTDAVNLQSLLNVYISNPSNSIESELFQLYSQLDLDIESGVQLDLIGKIVGLSRSGWSDYAYRLLLRAKIATNVSDGTYPRCLELLKWVTSNMNTYFERTAAYEVEIYSPEVIPSNIYFKFLDIIQKMFPAGVDIAGYNII